jgi:hypothetical protein
MNKKKINVVYGLVFILIIGLSAFFIMHKELAPADIQSTAKDSQSDNSNSEEVISEVPEKSALSPDNTKMAYVKWNDAISKAEVLTSNIDGSNEKIIATQEVGEGNGELDKDSIEWSDDGKYVTYNESQLTCQENCQSPSDASNMKVTYSVNIETGEKKITAKIPLEQN